MNENEKENLNFADAQQAAEQMFEQSNEEAERNALADRLEEQQEQQAAERAASEENLNEAVNTAETAAATAATADTRLNEATAENERLRQAVADLQMQMQQQNAQLEQMREREQQASDLQKQALMEQTLDMPSLDVSELAFADEETAARLQAEYANKMSEYVRGQVMNEFEPYIKEAEAARTAKERSRIIDALADDEAFSGIKENAPQIMRLIGNNAAKFAPDLSEEEKVAMAYILSRGVNAIQEPPKAEPAPPTVDELMRLYESNPEFQAAVEQKRIDSIKGSQQVPPMSASQGAANAALHIKDKPKSFDDAYEGVMRLFGARQ